MLPQLKVKLLGSSCLFNNEGYFHLLYFNKDLIIEMYC